MRVSVHVARARTGERGAIVVMVALWLPLLLVCMTFVVDVGNWFVHKRHLQMQADAAALAGAHEFRFPCVDAPVLQKAAEYSGDTYNAQIGGTPTSRVHRLINSATFYNQPSKPDPDDTATGPPCTAGAIDVKLTETDLPWYFKPVAGLLGGSSPIVPFINAQARVSINQLDSASGSLPIGVPDVNPKSAHAWFIDEDTGAVLKETLLTRVGTSNGLIVWDNAASPLPVKFDTTNVNVGVVVALGGLSSTTCGQFLVHCFDAGSGTTGGLPSRGILRMRGYSNAGSGAQPANDPILRGVTLIPGTSGGCADPYFSSAASTCTVRVRAKVDFGSTDPSGALARAKVTGKLGATPTTLLYDSPTGTWESSVDIPLTAGAGPVDLSMNWEETAGTLTSKGVPGTNNCGTNSTKNLCKGSFGGSSGAVVHRAFSAVGTRSGPIKVAEVLENGTQWANSVERCSAVQANCTHNMVVRIGVAGNLANAASAADPIVAMRVVGGSQNQAVDCDTTASFLTPPTPPAYKFDEELANGCRPTYKRNTGTPCAGPNVAPGPFDCVAVDTGGKIGQFTPGLNQRILGSTNPTSCTAPNNWSRAFTTGLPFGDPRLIQVMLTPYGSFTSSGNEMVPVMDFASFYVTGWSGNGTNPCAAGDDPIPGNDKGTIVGHFVKYIQSLNTGGGTTACDPNAFGACVAVMSR